MAYAIEPDVARAGFMVVERGSEIVLSRGHSTWEAAEIARMQAQAEEDAVAYASAQIGPVVLAVVDELRARKFDVMQIKDLLRAALEEVL